MAGDYTAETQSPENENEPYDPGVWQFGDCDIFYGVLTLATQAKSKTIDMVTLPAGFTPILYVMAGPTLSTAKISIGITGTATKYRASGVFTATTEVVAIIPAVLEAAEEILISNDGTATLPASGTLSLAFIGRRAGS